MIIILFLTLLTHTACVWGSELSSIIGSMYPSSSSSSSSFNGTTTTVCNHVECNAKGDILSISLDGFSIVPRILSPLPPLNITALCKEIPNLREVTIRNIPFEAITSDGVQGCVSLEILRVTGCGMKSKLPFISSESVKLRVVDFSNNSFASDAHHAFDALSSLQEVDVSHNSELSGSVQHLKHSVTLRCVGTRVSCARDESTTTQNTQQDRPYEGGKNNPRAPPKKRVWWLYWAGISVAAVGLIVGVYTERLPLSEAKIAVAGILFDMVAFHIPLTWRN